MKQPRLMEYSDELVKLASQALERAWKRGDLVAMAMMIKEQRHTLKWLVRLSKERVR
jgi:hypothetical protein